MGLGVGVRCLAEKRKNNLNGNSVLRPEMVWSEKVCQTGPFQSLPPAEAPSMLRTSSNFHTSL